MPVRRLRRHLTFANVVACLALFIALGGASYAAFKLPKNSVGTKQLKKNAVTGAKVKDGSLLAKDFEVGQLPAGPRGAVGPQGVAGTPGPAGATGPSGEAAATALPHARIARLSSDQSVTTSSAQHVSFDSVIEDPTGMTDLTTRPATLQVPRSGLYFLAAQLSWNGIEGSGRMGGEIHVTKDPAGNEYLPFKSVQTYARAQSPLNYLIQPMAEAVRLKAGQYVTLIVYQETGSTNLLIGEGEGTWLEATYLGP